MVTLGVIVPMELQLMNDTSVYVVERHHIAYLTWKLTGLLKETRI